MTPEGFSRKKTFRLKAVADRYAAAMVSSKADGVYIDSAAGKVTFQDYAEQWRAIQVHRSGTAAQIETNLRRHVYPVIGARPIGAIRHSEVQALVKNPKCHLEGPDRGAGLPVGPDDLQGGSRAIT